MIQQLNTPEITDNLYLTIQSVYYVSRAIYNVTFLFSISCKYCTCTCKKGKTKGI